MKGRIIIKKYAPTLSLAKAYSSGKNTLPEPHPKWVRGFHPAPAPASLSVSPKGKKQSIGPAFKEIKGVKQRRAMGVTCANGETMVKITVPRPRLQSLLSGYRTLEPSPSLRLATNLTRTLV